MPKSRPSEARVEHKPPPRFWTSSVRAVSKRAGEGTARRRSTSPSVTTSCISWRASGATEPNSHRRTENHRGRDQLRPAISSEDDAGGARGPHPGRERTQIEDSAGFAILWIGRDLCLEWHQFGTISGCNVVGT